MFKASCMAESATSVGSLTFLGWFAMFGVSPHFTLHASRKAPRECPLAKFEAGIVSCAGHEPASIGRLSAPHPEPSYGLGDTKEMAAINRILIIVNSAVS